MSTEYIELSDPTFTRIEKYLKESYSGACICWIEKITNPELEKRYSQFKASCKIPFQENLLFHGTQPNIIDVIIKEGFDPSKNTRSRLGKGTYFAKHASYSCDFSTPTSDGLCYMILADVVTNENTKTDPRDQICVVPHKDACIPRYVFAFSK